jgi:RNA polymerase sigma-70 factor, ECF subfamily
MKNSWTGGEAAYAAETVEENLAVSVCRREAGAFERLIDRFEAPLFNYAHGLLQNPMDAQEAVQDALMGVHRMLSQRYDEERCAALALRPWLFRAVRNRCLNKRRSKGRSLERPLQEFDDGRIGPFVKAVGSDFERQEEIKMLREAISGLPVEARELIVLRFIEEMPYAEIARTVGSREAPLRGKVFRALKLLREALERKGVTHAM